MYDQDDHFGRWVQFVCAIPLLLIGGTLLYITLVASHELHSIYYGSYRLGSGGFVCVALAGRCLWYAATGRNNINNKDL
jgi:hypothetical protein